MLSMNIGEAAAAAGVTPKMIRHYESLGLLPEPDRTEAGYRLFTAREVEMLRFIRQARALGFPIAQIDELLALWKNEARESRDVLALAQRQLADLEQRERELNAMRMALASMVDECANDGNSCCSILLRLADASTFDAHSPMHASQLKQVKPGSSVKQSRRSRISVMPGHAAHVGHSALVAWSRSFSPA
jgi:Cu(I)-responsive transcriptional regulator